ncbi:CatB-related O-acetyltransferase [Campylobacter vicugnae]|uniref:CatB-related O-acetyltransferase n=1 Tax=Campylobacter vicugnae TaxID=1660076 RepID=UPI000A34E4AE|nr:CatB-related O-acetyltransferase [Campylobacter sp. RM8965]
MKIKANKFVREYLEEFNVLMSYPNGKVCRYKNDEIINVPDTGFMEEYSTINKGNNACQMGSFSYSNAIIPRLDIKMGRYCSIANGLSFIAGKHPLDTISTSSFIYDPNFYIFKDASMERIKKSYTHTPYGMLIPPSPPTIFENDVYVCTNALLKPGITLHTGCVVAQNAIVTKDVPPYAIVGGSPARILKYRFDELTIKRLLELKWWEYHFADFDNIDPKKDINYYLDELEDRIIKRIIKPFDPKKMQFEELIQRSKQQILITKPTSQSSLQPTPQEQIKLLQDKINNLEINYQKALKTKNHLSYKLGEALIRANKNWYKGGYVKFIFEVIKIKKEHKTNINNTQGKAYQ